MKNPNRSPSRSRNRSATWHSKNSWASRRCSSKGAWTTRGEGGGWRRRGGEMRELIARQQAAARDKALRTWTDKIRDKIRGNIILPQDIPGNPEAIFDVTLLPSGEVLTVRKGKSSGHAGYDDAVERAIMKSSPLPLPDDRTLFQRRLELKFRPQDR